MTTPTERNTMNDLQRLVPEGTTHFTIEERSHRGSTVYAVVAIVPDGAAVPLNGYSTRELAESTAAMLTPTGRANPHTPPRVSDEELDEQEEQNRTATIASPNPTTHPIALDDHGSAYRWAVAGANPTTPTSTCIACGDEAVELIEADAYCQMCGDAEVRAV
jgi:hypothetical protein